MHFRELSWLLALLVGLSAASAAAQELSAEGVARPSVIAGAAPDPSPVSRKVDPLFVDDRYADFPDDLDAEFESDFDAAAGVDPMEGINRGTLSFNRFLDRWVFDPITNTYQFVFPVSVRRGIHNLFLNLESPVVFANQVLQLRGKAATLTLGRFLVNTTAGAGGIFDAAGRGIGWHRTRADFGQTLAFWGSPSGAYLVVPILGPSTVRDFGGDIVDRLLDPLTYVIGPITWWVPLGVGHGLSVREAHAGELHQLEESSVDFYAALRSAYLQNREADIRLVVAEGPEPAKLAVEGIPSREPEG